MKKVLVFSLLLMTCVFVKGQIADVRWQGNLLYTYDKAGNFMCSITDYGCMLLGFNSKYVVTKPSGHTYLNIYTINNGSSKINATISEPDFEKARVTDSYIIIKQESSSTAFFYSFDGKFVKQEQSYWR